MTRTQLEHTVTKHFYDRFNHAPQALVLAPGRVNLIGEYTDLNNGFVLPVAIDRYLAMVVKKRTDEKVVIHSVDFDETVCLDLDRLEKNNHSFQEYISGCLWALGQKGFSVKGFDAVIAGNIPIGAGLSSSAALELATLRAAAYSGGFTFDAIKMAGIARFAENRWVGVNCGIMDQLMSAAGIKGHALLIDCSTLELNACPVPDGVSVIILDTDTRRGLVDSAYNERREQCLCAAEIMGVSSLRQADETLLAESKNRMDDLIYNRARHVILENARVLSTARAMKRDDAATMGRLMKESHDSLDHLFEVTSPALNDIVACSIQQSACLGARMTGAGFGGCAVALVKKGLEDDFIRSVTACYGEKTGLTPGIYICSPSEGVTLKELK
ncbi:MAG: galactokinase [Desulfobacterales bacterium]|nr:galactokinase [Desulfobacterales bacterium]